MKKIICLVACILLSGCAHMPVERLSDNPELYHSQMTELYDVTPPERKAVVAVYDFPDLTGQRKDKDNVASFSNAATKVSNSAVVVYKLGVILQPLIFA